MRKTLLKVLPIILMIVIMVAPALASADLGNQLGGLKRLIDDVVSFIAGLAAAVFTIIFIVYGFKLAGSSGNPQARANAITGMWWSGLGALLAFGAVGIANVLKGISTDYFPGK